MSEVYLPLQIKMPLPPFRGGPALRPGIGKDRLGALPGQPGDGRSACNAAPGKVKIRRGPWKRSGFHDDEVDTCCGALEMLNPPMKG